MDTSGEVVLTQGAPATTINYTGAAQNDAGQGAYLLSLGRDDDSARAFATTCSERPLAARPFAMAPRSTAAADAAATASRIPIAQNVVLMKVQFGIDTSPQLPNGAARRHRRLLDVGHRERARSTSPARAGRHSRTGTRPRSSGPAIPPSPPFLPMPSTASSPSASASSCAATSPTCATRRCSSRRRRRSTASRAPAPRTDALNADAISSIAPRTPTPAARAGCPISAGRGAHRHHAERLALSRLRSRDPASQLDLQRHAAPMTPHLAQLVRMPRRQRGVVLFVALIAMLLLSLAGIALVRSVDTSRRRGRQPRLSPRVHRARSTRPSRMRSTTSSRTATPVATIADDLAHNYFATLQAGEIENRRARPAAGRLRHDEGRGIREPWPAPWVDPISGTELRWIVERMCNGPPRPARHRSRDHRPLRHPAAEGRRAPARTTSASSARASSFRRSRSSASPCARTSSIPTPSRTRRLSSDESRFDRRGVPSCLRPRRSAVAQRAPCAPCSRSR